MQRLFEQTWELEPLSVRNTFNGLLWIGGLAVYVALSGVIHAVLGRSRLELTAALLVMPLSAVFLVWSGWVLSAKRIARQDLLPFAILGSALLAVYSVGATVYVPHLFSTYATRYGVIGAVFAMISALFCVMVVVVGSAAAGREVHDELDRIRRGERPRRRRGPAPVGRGHRPGAVALGHAAGADRERRRRRDPERLRTGRLRRRYARAVEIVALGPGDDAAVVAAQHLFDGPAKAEETRRFLCEPGHHLLIAREDGRAGRLRSPASRSSTPTSAPS